MITKISSYFKSLRIFGFIFFTLLIVTTVTTTIIAGVDGRIDNRTLFSEDSDDVVYFVPQFTDFDEISAFDMIFLKKTLKRAKNNNVKAVIFEIDTPGGRTDIALKYFSILSKSEVPTIAYVNPNGISAGMIIALSADRVVINPNGMIGDAMPLKVGLNGVKPIIEKRDDAELDLEENENVDPEKKKKIENRDKIERSNQIEKLFKEIENLKKGGNNSLDPEEQKIADQKFLTVYFKVLQVIAEKNNRPVRVIRAMADPYQQLNLEKDGYEHTKKSPLTLSAKEAKKLRVVDYICKSTNNIKEVFGLEGCETVVIERSAGDKVADFIAAPYVSAILILIGIIGIYVEITTPGFGVPGIMGVSALSIFFIGHILTGDSNWGPAVIFFIGVILIVIEVFLVPGFGVVGVIGIGCFITSLFLAFGFENLEKALYAVSLSLLAAIITIILLSVYVLPRSRMFNRITLNLEENSEDGYSAHSPAQISLVGKTGFVYAKLRPTGIVVIDDVRIDCMTEGEFIEKGEEVKVIQANGMSVVVRNV